ncbi:MAG: AAA family ATPase [Proteobacteria bacterium]|nr:AAA family ATPase [Pseudomonadota bacterium]
MDARGGVDPAAASNLFNSFANGIRSQPGLGRSAALRAVAAVSGDAEGAQRLLRICRAVSGAVSDAQGGIQGGTQGSAQGGPAARDTAVIEEIRAVLDVPAPEALDETFANRDDAAPGPFVITLGNEKGGTGKSTTAMHLAVALLKLGYKVGTIDLDGRQGTLSRYLTNRRTLAKTIHRDVPMPLHRRIEGSEADRRQAAESEDKARLCEAFVELADRQIVIVDTPGGDSYLSRLAHANADMLITPINDTLLDIDILAHIDPSKREVRAPSAYCQMVWKQNGRRLASGRKPIDWIVMRNRLTHIDAHNKRAVADLLDQLAERLGFRLAPGFGERVIFHELFLTGLTVLDLPDDRLRGWSNVSLSHARREIHDLLLAVGVPETELAQSTL